MKIHIVQQGDTLWNLAQKYGVDFDELLQVNGHLANPDMLMPGMKIKIPTTAVPAKKEVQKGKVAPTKKAPKKELPKKEITKVEFIKEESPEVLEIAEEIDVVKLKEMVKKTAPHVLKKLIVEHKPEVVQQIQIEIINQHKETEVKVEQHVHPMPKVEYAPPPMPKVEPYIPPKPMPKPVYMAPQVTEPCPPLPWPTMGHAKHCPCPVCSHKKHHHMLPKVGPMIAGDPPPMHGAGMPHGQFPGGAPMQMLPQMEPYMPQTGPWTPGLPPSQEYGMMPSFPHSPMGGQQMPHLPMGGYGQYPEPPPMGPSGNYGYLEQLYPPGNFMRDESRQGQEEQEN